VGVVPGCVHPTQFKNLMKPAIPATIVRRRPSNTYAISVDPSTVYAISVAPSTIYAILVAPSTVYVISVAPSTVYTISVAPSTIHIAPCRPSTTKYYFNPNSSFSPFLYSFLCIIQSHWFSPSATLWQFFISSFSAIPHLLIPAIPHLLIDIKLLIS